MQKKHRSSRRWSQTIKVCIGIFVFLNITGLSFIALFFKARYDVEQEIRKHSLNGWQIVQSKTMLSFRHLVIFSFLVENSAFSPKEIRFGSFPPFIIEDSSRLRIHQKVFLWTPGEWQATMNHGYVAGKDLYMLAAVVDTDDKMESICQLSQLHSLGARKIQGKSLVHLRELSQISFLILEDCYIDDSDLEHLQELSSLTGMHIYNSEISDGGLLHLNSLPQLSHLSLRGNEITDLGLSYLQQNSQLQVLDLDETNVSDGGMPHLVALRELRNLGLIQTLVTDKGLKHLKDLRELRELRIGQTEISDQGLRELASLPKLEVLHLSACHITDAGLSNLEGLDNLKSLSLNATKIRGIGLAHLKKLPKLEDLWLSDTSIDDYSLLHLRGLPLQTLGLENTRISDQCLPTLKNIETLRYLFLTDSKVSRQAVEKFRQERPNCTVSY